MHDIKFIPGEIAWKKSPGMLDKSFKEVAGDQARHLAN
jgi:hypothetical protein